MPPSSSSDGGAVGVLLPVLPFGSLEPPVSHPVTRTAVSVALSVRAASCRRFTLPLVPRALPHDTCARGYPAESKSSVAPEGRLLNITTSSGLTACGVIFPAAISSAQWQATRC